MKGLFTKAALMTKKRNSRQGTRIDTQQLKSEGNYEMTQVQQAQQEEQLRLERIKDRDEDNLATARAVLNGTYVSDDADGDGSKVDSTWWVNWSRMIIKRLGTQEEQEKL